MQAWGTDVEGERGSLHTPVLLPNTYSAIIAVASVLVFLPLSVPSELKFIFPTLPAALV